MFIKLYFIALPVFFAIDIVWLGLIAKNFYAKQIGYLMKTDINWTAAILFYLLFIVGLVLFVIIPAVEKGSWVHSLLFGALFGLIRTYLKNVKMTCTLPKCHVYFVHYGTTRRTI